MHASSLEMACATRCGWRRSAGRAVPAPVHARVLARHWRRAHPPPGGQLQPTARWHAARREQAARVWQCLAGACKPSGRMGTYPCNGRIYSKQPEKAAQRAMGKLDSAVEPRTEDGEAGPPPLLPQKTGAPVLRLSLILRLHPEGSGARWPAVTCPGRHGRWRSPPLHACAPPARPAAEQPRVGGQASAANPVTHGLVRMPLHMRAPRACIHCTCMRPVDAARRSCRWP